MLVYRVQGIDGVGFYNSTSRFDGLCGNPLNNYRFCPPARDDDGPISTHQNAWFAFDYDIEGRPLTVINHAVTRFGFTSLCQMRRWFSQWNEFTLFGPSTFRVMVYDVAPEYVLTGAAQCVFDSSKAQCVAEFAIKREKR